MLDRVYVKILKELCEREYETLVSILVAHGEEQPEVAAEQVIAALDDELKGRD